MEREVLSYNLLVLMKGNYTDGLLYTGLKERLKIPSMFDFAIKFETLREVNMNRSIPNSVDVMAEDYIFGVLRDDGTLINERISFKIW